MASERQPINRESFSVIDDRLGQLRSIYPEAFADGKLDLARLEKAIDGSGAHSENELTSLSPLWSGKEEARRLAHETISCGIHPDPDRSINWEQARDVLIEGDNLLALKAILRSYHQRVKTILIDPPYNTGKDFIYEDDYSEPLDSYLRRSGQADESGNLLRSNPDGSARRHSDWLSMIYPRLLLARQLLRSDGAIFAFIDEVEYAHLKGLMDEIFGESNYIGEIVWEGGKKNDSRFVSVTQEYILIYARDIEALKAQGSWRVRKQGLDKIYKQEAQLRKLHGENFAAAGEAMREWYRSLAESDPAKQWADYANFDARGLFKKDNLSKPGGDGKRYEVLHPETQKPVKQHGGGWRYGDPEHMQSLVDEGRIFFGPDETTAPLYKRYLRDTEYESLAGVFYKSRRGATQSLEKLMGTRVFDFPKDTEVLGRLIEAATPCSEEDPTPLVLDFFAGSGSTHEAVLRQNAADGGQRRVISIQIPERIEVRKKSDKAAQNALDLGFETVCDVTAARIAKVIESIEAERSSAGEVAPKLGLRTFRLEAPDILPWQTPAAATAEEYAEAVTASVEAEPLREGWSTTNLLWEAALKEGWSLETEITELDVPGQSVWQLRDGDKIGFACFDERINVEGVLDAVPWPEGNSDAPFYVRDRALDAENGTHLAQHCRLRVI